jgi:serine/threonine-protein kinase
VAALALLAFGWSRMQRPAQPETPVIRAALDLPTGEDLMVGGFPIVLSPQGDQIAYISQSASGYRTVVRRTNELDARTVLAPGALRNVTFSPDGRWIAYTEGREVRRVSSEGGEHENVGSLDVDVIEGLAWTTKDELVIGTGQGLFLLPARGGAARMLVDSAQATGMRYPWAMPDGKTVIARGGQQLSGRLVTVDLESGRETDLALPGDRAHGIIDGHLVFQTRAGVLSAVPFDAGALRTTGDVFVIESDARGVGLSASGTLAYVSGATARVLVLTGRGGETVLRDAPATYSTPRFSPDGRRIAVAVATADGTDVWVLDRTANTFSRITTAGVNTAPEWTADGRQILYREAVGGDTRIMLTAADGSSAPAELYANGYSWNEGLLSADGRWLIIRTSPDNQASRDIFAVDLKGDRTLRPLVTGPTSETMPRLSPDGRWLAYQSDVSGQFEVYVRPFPNDGARVQVSDAGGTEPIWSRDGRTLYYRGAQGIVATTVTAGAEMAVGARRLVVASTEPPDPTHQSYDVTPDGSAFLFSRPAGGQVTAVVIHNWRREFRERLQRATSSPNP